MLIDNIKIDIIYLSPIFILLFFLLFFYFKFLFIKPNLLKVYSNYLNNKLNINKLIKIIFWLLFITIFILFLVYLNIIFISIYYNLFLKYILIWNNYLINIDNILVCSKNSLNYYFNTYVFCLNLPILINSNGLITPNTKIEQRLIGALLGDGWLERKSNTSNVRFKYEQSYKHEGRFYFLYYYLVFYCLGYPIIKNRLDKRTNNNYYTLHFSTRALPLFVPFYLMFYPEGKKRIPSNIIFYLTPIALAQLIMDDGTWAKSGVILQTNGFLVEDVNILIEALNKNFNLTSYMRFENNQPIIYIKSKDIVALRSIVLPFMHPSTYYKLGL